MTTRASLSHSVQPQTLADKLTALNWALPALALSLAAVGVMALYSMAGGRLEPWALRHGWRTVLGLGVMLAMGLVPPKAWLRLAYPMYLIVLAMLVAVAVGGIAQSGARRWLGVGDASLQPAELMKVALIVALARFYQWLPPEKTSRPHWVLVPLAMIAVPAFLVLRQPDLGTALLIVAVGIAIMFFAGVRWPYFAIGAVGAASLATMLWPHLKGYQRQRLLTFLNPDSDPLGAGYHITQSKIALGSGGLHGRGFLGGTQSQLNFLPEKHTDFIFTMFAEETGFVGAILLLALYASLIAVLLAIAVRGGSTFARLLAGGVAALMALHVSVNVGMVMGLVPVVGVPLPLVSYGGTSLVTTFVALGLVLSMTVHRGDRNLRREVGVVW